MRRFAPWFLLAQCSFLFTGLALQAQAVESSGGDSSAEKKLTKIQKLQQTQRMCFKDALPCVLLLNEKGSIGCAQCDNPTRVAPLLEFDNIDEYKTFLNAKDQEKRVLMISENLFFQAESVLKELVNFQDNVAAVIVFERRIFSDLNLQQDSFPWPPPAGYSGDRKYPNTKYNHPLPDESLRPENEKNTGFQFVSYPFNIFFISADDARLIREGDKRFPTRPWTRPTAPRFKVESNGRMSACPTVDPQANVSSLPDRKNALRLTTSVDCLRERTCKPVGGFSVWSSLKYLERSSTNLSVVAVTAPMDSTAIFHDLAYGAAAEIASLASLMAVVKSVGDYSRLERRGDIPMKRHPMYFAFNAQSWGYSGSSRFLSDVKNVVCEDPDPKHGKCNKPYYQSMKFKTLENANFSVINLGGLVNSKQAAAVPTVDYSFFLHGNASGGAVEEALRKSFNSSDNLVSIFDGFRGGYAMDASQSFQSYWPDAEVLSVTNFKHNFTNKYYHSPYDNASFIVANSRKPLYAAAASVARAVIDLSYEVEHDVRQEPELIDSLIDCFTTNWREKNCSLAQEYLGDDYDKNYTTIFGNVVRSNFAGVYVPLGHLQNFYASGYGKALFIQRFMAYHNRIKTDLAVPCTTNYQCNASVQIPQNANNEFAEDFRTAFCVKGTCVIAESHFHNAFGTGLVPDNVALSNYTVITPSPSPPPSPPTVNQVGRTTPTPLPDMPAWTESDWERSLGMCYVIEDTYVFGAVILVAGLSTLIACLLAVWLFKRSVLKAPDDALDERLLPVDSAPVMGSGV